MKVNRETPETAKSRHREALVLAFLVVAAALLLQVGPDEKVAVRGFPDHPLPSSCPSLRLSGVKCPLCGMSRSLILLSGGDWRGSFRRHRLGWLLAAVVLFQVPYRLVALSRPARASSGGRGPRLFLYTVLFLLIGNWLLELCTGSMP